MIEQSPTDQTAADMFLAAIISRAYDDVVDSMSTTLGKGPPGRKPPQSIVALHRWYQSLDDQTRRQVMSLVKETAEQAVFGCLVILDGESGGYPIHGQISDYAVALQTYRDDSDRMQNAPETSVRINPSTSTDFLHERFLLMLQQRRK